MSPEQRIAIVGAGPVGLALAIALADAGRAPQLFDAQALDGARRDDPRQLALSLGSIQWLRRLGAWPEAEAEPMTEVQVSQVPPGRSQVRLRAAELGLPLLGAVLGYGVLQQALQQAWLSRPAAAHCSRGGQPVQAYKPLPDGSIELDTGIAERFDLVVLAEGGLYGEQAANAQHAWQRPYKQLAWIGTLRLGQSWPRGLAVERFTRDGPLAVLPQGGGLAALVWCTAPDESAEQLTLARLRALLPAEAADIAAIEGPLRAFPLGLNATPRPYERRHGRLLRIGNAAQTLHPVAGQGLNLGLRDAHELAQLLRDGGDLDALLARYSRRRAPDRLALLATTDLLARGFALDSAPVTLAREAGLALLQRLPPLRHALARQLMFGWRP